MRNVVITCLITLLLCTSAYANINILFLPDGFTSDELPKFHSKVEDLLNVFIATPPFDEFEFSIYMEDVVSKESGTSYPANGDFKDTAFGSGYGYGGIPRCLAAKAHVVKPYVNMLSYDVDYIVVLVNDDGIGGCSAGGFVTSSLQPKYIKVVIHELGHVIAGLGDEAMRYDEPYPYDEPDSPNLTTNDNINTVKWRHLIEPGNGVGLYEGGGQYTKGIYRPMQVSLMGALEADFGVVNEHYLREALKEKAGTQAPPLCNGKEITIMGTDGDDRLRGGFGDDVIYGGKGNDRIYGVFGNDTLCGGDGDDYLDGSFGDDTLLGGNGNDTFRETFGNDLCDGGQGVDEVKFRRECEIQVNIP